ncbi:MAG: rod shape-determining protein MreC [Eubacteriales bacterium]
MDRFFRNKPLVVTVILVIIILALLVSTSGMQDISGGQTVAGGVFIPVQRFFYQITDSLSSSVQKTFNTSDLEKENQDLKDQLSNLKSELSDYDELQKENVRLTKLLDYEQKQVNYKFKVANIVAKDPGIWFDSFTINLGSNDGLSVDMPVVTPDGVIGRVEEVGLNWSKVMTIIDGRSGASSIIDRTRDIGSVRGRMESEPSDPLLDMDLLPMDTDIQVGDNVLTSGVGGIYPKGLTIGQVVEVGTESNQKKVVIKSTVDFRNLEEVLVMVNMGTSAGTSTGTSAGTGTDSSAAPSGGASAKATISQATAAGSPSAGKSAGATQ